MFRDELEKQFREKVLGQLNSLWAIVGVKAGYFVVTLEGKTVPLEQLSATGLKFAEELMDCDDTAKVKMILGRDKEETRCFLQLTQILWSKADVTMPALPLKILQTRDENNVGPFFEVSAWVFHSCSPSSSK